MAVENTSRN